MQKSIFCLLVGALLAFNNNVLAGYEKHSSFQDEAKVIKVKPIYKEVQSRKPHKQCYEQEISHEHYDPVYYDDHDDYGGMIVGGIIGGVAGHQVGKGRGKDVATVAGTLIGAVVGDNLSKNKHYRPYNKPNHHVTYETSCDTIYNYETHQEIVGYRVKYSYQGRHFWTTMDHRPGSYISVKVKLRPVS